MRPVFLSLVVWLVPVVAIAQDAEAGSAASPAAEVPASNSEGTRTSETATDAEPPATGASPVVDAPPSEPGGQQAAPAVRPKVAVIVVGDPDPVLVAAAVELEAHLSTSREVRLPADVALRAALRGDTGESDDGLAEVRRERRRLGLGEAEDAPVLARLGRRAGAVLVLAVREAPTGPEAIGLDVRTGQYFDGVLDLAAPAPERSSRFAVRRARVAARGAVASAPSPSSADTEGASGPSVPPAALEVPAEGANEPDWFEQNWPYFAAGGLLAAAIAFVVVTATDGGDPPPMLRFQPPGAQ